MSELARLQYTGAKVIEYIEMDAEEKGGKTQWHIACLMYASAFMMKQAYRDGAIYMCDRYTQLTGQDSTGIYTYVLDLINLYDND